MYTRSEGFFTGFQDARLYYQKWIHSKAKGHILITHGHGEHSDCYHRVIDALANESWSFLAWDWRGHGRSEGPRGYAHTFHDYCHDFEVFYNLLQTDKSISSKPLILLGHSMGGLIQLKSQLSHPTWKFDGQVLSSPLLGIALAVPAYKDTAARLLVNLLPKVTLWNEIPDTDLSRDPEVLKEYQRDVLRHARMSAGVYLGSVEAMDFVKARAQKIQTPTLMQLAGKDKVVSTPIAAAFFEKIAAKNKKIKIYPNHLHEIYNDLQREEVFSDLKEFLRNF